MTRATPPRVLAHLAQTGTFTAADESRDPYRLIPFDVPARGAALRVRLAYARRDGHEGPVLDLGLFGPGDGDGDAAGTERAGDAKRAGDAERAGSVFRGYSGGEREEIIVGRTGATPGYRPGPIDGGRWNVLLGLSRLAAEPVAWRLDVELLADEPDGLAIPPTSPADGVVERDPASPSAGTADRWIACDFHAHTEHSDGKESIGTVARRGAAAGLELLAISDHNTDSHVPFLPAAARAAGLVVIPGAEVTTFLGHLNAIGVDRWIEFRHRDARGIARAIDAIHAGGGLASTNHPRGNTHEWRFGPDAPFDAVEVWNGPWRNAGDEGWKPGTANELALEWWHELRAAGRRVTAIGGSDTHSPAPADQPIGTPVTWVRARVAGRERVLEAIRSGRVVITRDAGIPPPEVTLERDHVSVSWTGEPDARVVAIDDRGRGTESRATRNATLAVEPDAAWVRIEVRGPDASMLALTNPIERQRDPTTAEEIG